MWRKQMKVLVIPLLLAFACGSGCGGSADVDFEWFNLSANEIFVTDAVGLPDQSLQVSVLII